MGKVRSGGPVVGHSNIEVKRRSGANGSPEFVFYSGTQEVVFRLDTNPTNRLKPFVLMKEDGYRFDLAYDWAGTEAAVVKDEGAQPEAEEAGSVEQR